MTTLWWFATVCYWTWPWCHGHNGFTHWKYGDFSGSLCNSHYQRVPHPQSHNFHGSAARPTALFVEPHPARVPLASRETLSSPSCGRVHNGAQYMANGMDNDCNAWHINSECILMAITDYEWIMMILNNHHWYRLLITGGCLWLLSTGDQWLMFPKRLRVFSPPQVVTSQL